MHTGVVGLKSGLKDVFSHVSLISHSDVPVLLLGETGSGKEVVARAIHKSSKRSSKPFIRVNCGAIQPELIDSQLFGHERGSFTGAVNDHMGWFERADGGTLFLDEVGELSLAAQVRLLCVLQDGMFERLGGKKSIKVDVRIIAATHRKLETMTKDGSFREDLLYRLSIYPINIPPLRERMDDIPELVSFFAAKSAEKLGIAPTKATDADIKLLRTYGWPGNIREFSAVIERAVILGMGKTLDIYSALNKPSESFTESDGRFLTFDEMAKKHIEDAIRRCGGKMGGEDGAAELLGLNLSTLRGKMRKYGIKS
jgi:transcriptional regulator with GAF, ATPase, and Fis domain